MRIQEALAKNVRNYRNAAGLSQWQLVERIENLGTETGIDQAYISLLENGKKNPTLISLWFIAQALNVTVAQLVDENEKKA